MNFRRQKNSKNLLLRKQARELHVRIRVMSCNPYLLDKHESELSEINKLLSNNCKIYDIEFVTILNLKKIAENPKLFKRVRPELLRVLFNLNNGLY